MVIGSIKHVGQCPKDSAWCMKVLFSFVLVSEIVLKSITEYVKNVKGSLVPFGDIFLSIAMLAQLCDGRLFLH